MWVCVQAEEVLRMRPDADLLTQNYSLLLIFQRDCSYVNAIQLLPILESFQYFSKPNPLDYQQTANGAVALSQNDHA